MAVTLLLPLELLPLEPDLFVRRRVIDLPWIPPDLFTSNASAAMKERMPYVTDGPDGPHWTCRNGQSFGLMNGVGPAVAKYVPGSHYRVDVMASTGLYDDGKKGIRRPTAPELPRKAMD